MKLCSIIHSTINVTMHVGLKTIYLYDHQRMVSVITACMGSPMDVISPSPKTNGDQFIKNNLGRYCPKTFETAKGMKESWRRQESNPEPLA